MNFGVIIRSIGERTEELCYESVRQSVAESDIHILRNYYPSYKVFLEMFKIAKKMEYDWFLGLDADVILCENWLDLFKSKIENKNCDDIFRVQFYVKDGITFNNLVRGNNFYNGRFLELSTKYLKENIRIGKYWFLYKRGNYNTGYFTKPETSIRTHFREKKDILDAIYDEIIGYHAYEQYYSEIFRQYITRKQRDAGFATKHGNGFLCAENQQTLLHDNMMEQYIANIAWNTGDDFTVKHVDGRIRGKIEKYLFEKYNICENSKLNISLKDFYKKAGNTGI